MRGRRLWSVVCRRARNFTTDSAVVAETFAERAQADAGFYQGCAVFGIAGAAVLFTSDEQKSKGVVKAVDFIRWMGVKAENVSGPQIIKDHVLANARAMVNVTAASPAFYFTWHLIHGQSLSNCALRSVTGTMRTLPFMMLFYGGFAVFLPVLTDIVMDRQEQDYVAAKVCKWLCAGLILIYEY